MPDMEKVVKGLEHCPNIPFDICYAECNSYDCPYKDELGIQKLHADALALLKEQLEIVRCKDCDYYEIWGSDEKICTRLGKWYGRVPEDWFCAGGKRR